jgi:hypothetical protein
MIRLARPRAHPIVTVATQVVVMLLIGSCSSAYRSTSVDEKRAVIEEFERSAL